MNRCFVENTLILRGILHDVAEPRTRFQSANTFSPRFVAHALMCCFILFRKDPLRAMRPCVSTVLIGTSVPVVP